MEMHWIDWSILGALFAGLLWLLLYCRKFVRNTADFLAANRCAERYILAIASGIGAVGAISIIAFFELYYNAGFTPVWWTMLSGPVALIIAISGWVYYRRRETRTLTLAQFFEMRYSRNFRVFAGILMWISGLLNYGIFPAVSARFFLFYCGFPEYVRFCGVPVESYALLLTLFIGLGAAFACFGGQVAIMVTDFAQGMFCNVAFLILMVFFLYQFDWNDIFTTMAATAPAGKSLLNPFDTIANKDFSAFYFLIGIVAIFYTSGAWQGNMGYTGAAKTPHEAKMAALLGQWRGLIQGLLFMVIPICAYLIMNNAAFGDIAAPVRASLEHVEGAQLQKQLLVPMVLKQVLPVGLSGIFIAVMFAAMLSTDNTYMHSWGSIFIQDVVMPFRKRPFKPETHIRLLRLSILGVGAFAWLFSYFFRQTEYIMMWFAITGAVWLGGAGVVIIGGLYWKRGTTAAAWTALIIGSTIAVAGILIEKYEWLRPFDWMTREEGKFIWNGQIIYFGALVISTLSYIGISLAGRTRFNLDRMLHRGRYDTANEHIETGFKANRWLKMLGLTGEFTFTDRLLFYANIAWSAVWLAVFAAMTLYHVCVGISTAGWVLFWKIWVGISFVLGVGTTVWFLVGGSLNIRGLFRSLREVRSCDDDDGRVVDGRNAGEGEEA